MIARSTLAWTVTITLVVAPAAVAQQRPLTRADGGKTVIVWRSEQAYTEGARLIDAGVNKTHPRLLVPLVACIVPVGDKVVVTEGGAVRSAVTVISGKENGCRGVITNGYIRGDDAAENEPVSAETGSR